MEINAQSMDEYLRIQRQSQSQTNRQQTQNSAPNTFDAVFSDALNAQNQNSTNSVNGLIPHGVGQSQMISQMLLNNVDAQTSQAKESILLQSTFDNASGTLDLLDVYAQKLNSTDKVNLREAYSILETIGDKVEQLKTNAHSLSTPNFNLNSLINEIDIMATTEKIKFNRGDYA